MAIHRLGKVAKTLTPQFIAPQSNATSQHWAEHTNKRVLVEGRQLPWTPKPRPHTTLSPPTMQTPQSKHGTLVGDDGDSPVRRSIHRRKG